MKKTQKVMACSFVMLFTLFPSMSYALITTTTTTPAQNLPYQQTGLTPYNAPQGVTSYQQGGSTLSAPPSTVTTVPTTTTTTISGTGAVPRTGAASSQTTTETTTQQKVTAQNAPVEENLNIPPRAEPVTLRQIAELMIYESNITHGECACPYSPDRIGGQCGSESKYYKPHSDKIYCYYGDITNKDIHFYWLKNGIGISDYF